MGQETNVDEAAVAQKLLIDRPFDFRFHAAYLIYSQAWDRTVSQEVKFKLNDLMMALSKEEIGYEQFYGRVNPYRADFNPEHYSGGRKKPYIETQSKKDWRRKEMKDSRNSRYKR